MTVKVQGPAIAIAALFGAEEEVSAYREAVVASEAKDGHTAGIVVGPATRSIEEGVATVAARAGDCKQESTIVAVTR